MQNKLHGRCFKLEQVAGVPTRFSHAQTIPEIFSSLVHQTVRDVYLDGNQVPHRNLILERHNQKKVRDFEHLNLFHGNESGVRNRTSLRIF